MSKKRKRIHSKHVWRIAVHTLFTDNGMKSVLVVNFSVAGDEHIAEFDLPVGYTMDSIKSLLKLHGFNT